MNELVYSGKIAILNLLQNKMGNAVVRADPPSK